MVEFMCGTLCDREARSYLFESQVVLVSESANLRSKSGQVGIGVNGETILLTFAHVSFLLSASRGVSACSDIQRARSLGNCDGENFLGLRHIQTMAQSVRVWRSLAWSHSERGAGGRARIGLGLSHVHTVLLLIFAWRSLSVWRSLRLAQTAKRTVKVNERSLALLRNTRSRERVRELGRRKRTKLAWREGVGLRVG